MNSKLEAIRKRILDQSPAAVAVVDLTGGDSVLKRYPALAKAPPAIFLLVMIARWKQLRQLGLRVAWAIDP